MKDPNYEGYKIYHYVNSDRADTLVNGAFLMGCFMVVVMKHRTVQEACDLMKPYYPLFRHYRDASKGNCYYDLTLRNCWKGLDKACEEKWYVFKEFKVRDYEQLERLDNGDLNWIIPGKFAAFMGPIEVRDAQQRYGHHPKKYVDIFKEIGITRVIRLNEQKYDSKYFTN